MTYVDPRNVISPKDAVSNIRVIYDGDVNGISVALIDWYDEENLVMRWNVSSREWDDPDKISLKKECLGMPVSRGYPVWFVIPEEFFDSESKLWQDINTGIKKLKTL